MSRQGEHFAEVLISGIKEHECTVELLVKLV